MLSIFETNPQRKFIDLIHRETSKFANWEPPAEIKVGSYGTIDKRTGSLTVEGNIYSKEFKQHIPSDLDLSSYHPEDCPEDEEYVVWSSKAKKVDLGVSADLNVPGIASAAIKGVWEVKKGGRGAILLMYKPRLKRIPPGELLGKLAQIPELKSRHLVTGVYYCPAYALSLSSTRGENISVALTGAVPASIPGLTAGGGVSMNWISNKQTGLLRSGAGKDHSFTPLYDLRQIIPVQSLHRSDSSPERKGDDLWAPAGLPWDPLDEDGEEVPIYEGDSDEDEDC
ncbi:hypothetical protein M422DRAFT_263133 [Sphaerobolus stellatus SS14]|uniref:Uncharacterized protein n=1 Tax=Sphaerobolus stellatus (strain SS14) TaxID=990650 RepID=A0A0C9UZN7_SPHS4|nr:hypothetical protein M422DRAFT_263133 [Sphaerobolus stellatus SS14]